jgi:hypothetical protein
VLGFLGGSAQRARPGRFELNLPLFRIAISITAILMKSGFSRISRCLGPGMGYSVTGFACDDTDDCGVEEGPTEG